MDKNLQSKRKSQSQTKKCNSSHTVLNGRKYMMKLQEETNRNNELIDI